jgi:hypothetical protein
MFKRVKTIGLTLVGLLAMLGTKVEAHYMYVSGEWVYHSVGCIAEIESVSDPATVPASVECVVATVQVETLCPDLSIVSSPIEVSLIAQAPITLDNIITEGRAQVEVIVPDTPLLNLSIVQNACITIGSTPIAVLIRHIESTVNVLECIGPLCLVRQLSSTFEEPVQCELPAQFNFGNHDGAAFICTDPVIEHFGHN